MARRFSFSDHHIEEKPAVVSCNSRFLYDGGVRVRLRPPVRMPIRFFNLLVICDTTGNSLELFVGKLSFNHFGLFRFSYVLNA